MRLRCLLGLALLGVISLGAQTVDPGYINSFLPASFGLFAQVLETNSTSANFRIDPNTGTLTRLNGAYLGKAAAYGAWVIFDGSVSGIHHLYRTDGTEAGTVDLKVFSGGTESVVVRGFQEMDGLLYMALERGTHEIELWVTDGSEAGTRYLADMGPIEPRWTAGGGYIYFAPDSPEDQGKIYQTDANGTTPSVFVSLGSTKSISDVAVNGGRVLIALRDGNNFEWWASDGSSLGTTLLHSQRQLNPLVYPAFSGAVGGLEFFNPKTAFLLPFWRTDGTAAGTIRLTDGRTFPTTPVTALGSIGLFSAVTPGRGDELWRTDGSVNGTGLVVDILPGPDWTSPHSFAPIGSTALMLLGTPNTPGSAVSAQLWRTDGTGGGTTMVKQIPAPGDPIQLSSLQSRDGVGYFLVDSVVENGPWGYQLWKSDGTEQGTVLVYQAPSMTPAARPASVARRQPEGPSR